MTDFSTILSRRSSSLPRSIRLASSRSSISRVAMRICCSIMAGMSPKDSGVRSLRMARPLRMGASGLRSSCERVARNVLLAEFARCSSAARWLSWIASCRVCVMSEKHMATPSSRRTIMQRSHRESPALAPTSASSMSAGFPVRTTSRSDSSRPAVHSPGMTSLTLRLVTCSGVDWQIDAPSELMYSISKSNSWPSGPRRACSHA